MYTLYEAEQKVNHARSCLASGAYLWALEEGALRADSAVARQDQQGYAGNLFGMPPGGSSLRTVWLMRYSSVVSDAALTLRTA